MTVERVLATDLDGTFIGDDGAMHGLWAELEETGVFVAFSTGRHLPSIRDFYAERDTARRADACICMVGTELWWRVDGRYERDHGWGAHISDAWDKEAVEAILAGCDLLLFGSDLGKTGRAAAALVEAAVVRPGLRRRLAEACASVESLAARWPVQPGPFGDAWERASREFDAFRHLV